MTAGQFTNSFNAGTDQSIRIMPSAGGAQLKLDGKRSMFEMEDNDILLKSEVIDNGGIPDHRVLADGWSGRIEVEKQSDAFGQLVAFLDANYYAGGLQQYFTIIETIKSPVPGGATTRYQYVDCVFHGYKPG